jgi:hypothetical protein
MPSNEFRRLHPTHNGRSPRSAGTATGAPKLPLPRGLRWSPSKGVGASVPVTHLALASRQSSVVCLQDKVLTRSAGEMGGGERVERRLAAILAADVAGYSRLIGAVLLEQNDEWLLQHRYMQIEGMAELPPPLIDADPTKLPPLAA